jgi:hypothetical protein
MSEQMAEQTSGEPGSLKAALSSLETPGTPFAVSAKEPVPETTNVDSPKLSPEQGGAGETLKVDTPRPMLPSQMFPRLTLPRLLLRKLRLPRPTLPRLTLPNQTHGACRAQS